MKKRGIKTQLKIAVIAVLFSLFVTGWTSAQQIDERLWGTWLLDTVELTAQRGATQQHSLTSLFADKSNLPRNMFTQLYFFDDQIGVCSTETEFVRGEEVSMKGSFTTNDGELIITIRGEQSRQFVYSIEDDLLKISYTDGDTQFYLIYKLWLKNVR